MDNENSFDFIQCSLIHLVSESTLDGVTDPASRDVAPLSALAAAAAEER